VDGHATAEALHRSKDSPLEVAKVSSEHEQFDHRTELNLDIASEHRRAERVRVRAEWFDGQREAGCVLGGHPKPASEGRLKTGQS
jgi:hypothetical protein